MRIAIAVVGVSVLIASALVVAMWRISGDEDFDPREPSFIDSLPTTDPTSFAETIRQLEILNPPPELIDAAEVDDVLGWRPLCPDDGADTFELSRDGRGLIHPPELAFPRGFVHMPFFVQQPGTGGLDFIPEPFAIESINGFAVALSKWGDRYDARFETGELANGEPVIASVTTREGDDDLRDFIESLTFECGDSPQ